MNAHPSPTDLDSPHPQADDSELYTITITFGPNSKEEAITAADDLREFVPFHSLYDAYIELRGILPDDHTETRLTPTHSRGVAPPATTVP